MLLQIINNKEKYNRKLKLKVKNNISIINALWYYKLLERMLQLISCISNVYAI